LREDCHRYFHDKTSIRVWIGIKVWVSEHKFWVGWAERNATGDRGIIHSDMEFPPHHFSIQNSVDIIYRIPMTTVYGSDIRIPLNSPNTLDIDCNEIRLIVLEFLQ